MTRLLSFLLLVAFGPLAYAQKGSKNENKVSPSDTVKKWIDAAGKRDMKTLGKLASRTTPRRSLKLIEEQGFLNYQGAAKIIHEEMSGDRAVVVYRLENRDAVFTAEIRYDVIVLVREGKEWKVTEQGGGVLKPGKQPRQ
jgi:hypothetical protein